MTEPANLTAVRDQLDAVAQDVCARLRAVTADAYRRGDGKAANEAIDLADRVTVSVAMLAADLTQAEQAITRSRQAR